MAATIAWRLRVDGQRQPELDLLTVDVVAGGHHADDRVVTPSIFNVRPTTLVSALKLSRQSESDRIATSSALGSVSSSVKMRPSAAGRRGWASARW